MVRPDLSSTQFDPDSGWHNFFQPILLAIGMTTESKILKALTNSQRTGRVVGIRLKQKSKPIVTAVVDISASMIRVKALTFYGHAITNRNILIEDIESVRSYSSYFEDPMFVRLRNLRNSIRQIRSAFSEN